MKRHLILYLILLLGLASCVDEYEVELPTDGQQTLVVEGSIVSGEDCLFFLTTTVPLNDKQQDYEVRGASVSVLGSDGTVWSSNRQQDCRYWVSVGQLRSEVQYWLEIKLQDGTEYQSTPASPIAAPEIQLTTYLADGPNPKVEVHLDAPDCREPMHLRVSYQEWWEIETPLISPYVVEAVWVDDHYDSIPMHHGYGLASNAQDLFINTEDFTDCHVRDYMVKQMRQTSPHLSKLYCTLITCQAVSEEEYRYEEARRKQTDEMGGLFTPQPGNLPSNVQCTSHSKMQAMGYVGVRGSVAKQYHWITPQEVGWYEIRKAEQKFVMAGSRDENKLSLNPDFRLYFMDEMSHMNTWVSRWEVDYTDPTWGGVTMTAPDFWPTEN